MPTPSTDDRRATLILVGLTLAGGLLRFAWLGHPCIWGDEALVYWRTCGTFADLLQPLHADGFPPLHYELYWVIVHALGRTPGPAAMRAAAAVCGTLMVPAVYALARQLLPRRASLVAAAFTAGSAFALFYSRDAKMYAEAWLMMTVSVACLLGWLRTGRATAWLGWVVAGAVAGGLQTLTLVSVAGLCPLLLLTQRRAHWRQTVLCLAGVALIVAGPIGYYARFNGWAEAVGDQGWRASGLAWVKWYNLGRTGPDHVRYLATTFLTGWEWPAPGRPSNSQGAMKTAATALAAVVLLGALPWRTTRALLAARRSAATTGDRDPSPVPDTDAGPEAPWRAALWLTAWVVLPVYGFYCRSVAGFVTPLDALGISDHPRLWTAAVAFATVAFVAAMTYRPTRATAVRWIELAVVFAAVVAACQAMAVGMAAAARAAAADGHPWESVWVPRYLGFVWPAVAVAVAALLDRLPTRAGRLSGLGLVLAANLGMYGFRVLGSTEPPVDRMAADVWAAQPRPDGTRSDTLTWTAITDHWWAQTGPGDGNLFSDPGRYYLQVLANRPMTPTRFKQSLGTFTLHRGSVADLPAAVTPGVRRAIVWEQSAGPPAAGDDLLPRLPGWRRSGDDAYIVRDAWTGQIRSGYRRREYVRPPATRP